MSTAATTAADVIAFWCDAGYERWFMRDAAFDAQCRTQFLDAHFAASRRELEPWMAGADGALALVLLLDQIPRNVFRGSAHSYATDPLARHYAAGAIDAGFDREVDPMLRVFFYMPFEHSEDMADQQRAVALAAALDDASYGRYAVLHRDVIARFGRFPHRNAVLGRSNTPEEQVWLDAGGGFG
jgi:uncharacterized protein (DUF924 family)